MVTYLKQIPKPGQEHSSKLNGDCVLTMQNTTGKLMERIVIKKLAQDLKRRNVLPQNQEGHRAGENYQEKQSDSHTMPTKDPREGKTTLAVAVDLEDTYYRVQYRLLIELLVQDGVSLALTR